jgi:hypothetical protein
VSDITNVRLGIDFESVTRFLLHGKKMKVLNVFSSMPLWTSRSPEMISVFMLRSGQGWPR